jgi:hypothetical protein
LRHYCAHVNPTDGDLDREVSIAGADRNRGRGLSLDWPKRFVTSDIVGSNRLERDEMLAR